VPFVEPFSDAVSGGAASATTRRLEEPGSVRLDLCGVEMTRTTFEGYLRLVHDRLVATDGRALAVGSVNLDHVHHFGRRRRGARATGAAGSSWLLLADGSPISARASALTGEAWPRLPGADLLPATLEVAQALGAGVGFLGGTDESATALREQLAVRWPDLRLAGCWTPPRADLLDEGRSALLAAEIARAGTDLLVVGLGKPLQEQWIDRHGEQTGARVLTAFGGAADFLGGTTRRAPRWMRAHGVEWAHRLATEPRRLSRRYVVQGPPALARLLTHRPGRVSR
jgi:exopolysaccharide biosynthesis WecB/TagA/CpsF family protein